MRKTPLIIIFLFFFIQKASSQQDWQIGVGAAIIKLSNTNAGSISEEHLLQLPRLNATTFFSKKISISIALSFSPVGDFEFIKNHYNYFSIDSFLRYSIISNDNKFDPYIIGGVSLFSIEKDISPAVNIGIGNIFWFTDNLGVSMQGIYKLSSSEKSHIQLMGGVVLKLDFGRKTSWN